MNNVIVDYSNFSRDNSIVEQITFDLLPNTTLILKQVENEETKSLTITMINTESEEIEISGVLDNDTINSLSRSLSIFKNQLND